MPDTRKTTKAKKTAKKAGRPSKFTDAVKSEICLRLYESNEGELPESLRAICRDSHMPDVATVCRYLEKDAEFSQQYARARSFREEALTDRLFKLAREALDHATGESAGARVQAIKLEVDTIKWILSKEYSRNYGDRLKQEITGADGGPIKQESEFKIDSDAEAMIKQIASAREKLRNGD